MGGHNIVLVSKSFDADGYDVRFRKSLKLGVPQRFDINKIEVDPRLTDLLKDRDIRETPSLWGLESISDEYDYIWLNIENKPIAWALFVLSVFLFAVITHNLLTNHETMNYICYIT